MERPLRLRFEATKDAMTELATAKPLLKMKEKEQSALLGAVMQACEGGAVMDRAAFREALRAAAKATEIKIDAPLQKAIEAALGTRDEEAAICRDKGSRPEPDPQLRDHEQVPLDENWQDYVAREVAPFVPDAWVDETYRDVRDKGVGRVGYEINFNRYFYRYEPPRPVEAIDSDLKELEAKIAGLLQEVVE